MKKDNKKSKTIKPHGMSSEKASRVKIRGHKKEHIYATLIGGEVVRGVKKEDVKDSKGKIHSLKGGGEIKGGEGRRGKWQIFLFKLSTFEREKTFPGRDFFINILKSYPNKHEQYQDNKKAVKENVKFHMTQLKDYLSNRSSLYNFVNKSFFDNRVDYFVIYHDDTFHIFDRSEAIKSFSNCLTVDNNRTFQKVILKYKDRIVGEVEVRTTNDGKYPSILFNMLKNRAINLLEEKIRGEKRLSPNIYTHGNASKSFEF